MKIFLSIIIVAFSLNLYSCTRALHTYYVPSGPGKTFHDYYSYELSNKVKINLELGKEPFSKKLALTIYVDNPKRVGVKFIANEFVFNSPTFVKPTMITVDYYDFVKGTESKLSIYDEYEWKLTKIIVRTNFVDIDDLLVEFPRLSIDGRVEDIPKVRFNKKEGYFWTTINR